MTAVQKHARRIVVRIPDAWQSWQFDWALEFLSQLERGLWDIFEQEHLHDVSLDDAPGDELHRQLELPLDVALGFTDDEIPF